MNKYERVRATLRCEEVDRLAYSFWTHLPEIDLQPDALITASAQFCRRYDLDLLKSMPNGLYCVEDWGAKCDYANIHHGGVANVTHSPIQTPSDWESLAFLDVTKGAFGRELKHLEGLLNEVGKEVPVLATVFSPFTIAAKLSRGMHREHARIAPESLMQGLSIISEVMADFARNAIRMGCSGVFFAAQDANFNHIGPWEYQRYGEPYDRAVLTAAKAAGGWCNTVHMHGESIYFDILSRYNVDALNWHIGETRPSIADYRKTGGTKPIFGGLQRKHITERNLHAINADLNRAIAESEGRGLIVAPGCVIRHPVNPEILTEAAQLIRSHSVCAEFI
ncbi:uroporphyrinogen decarboxylase family protein [Advenella incenata]|jgi:uroporphyrinogen decarboxylase